MTPKEILTEARKLISEPEHWTQSSFAKDKYGCPVSLNEPTAYCFCALGAIMKVTGLNTEAHIGKEIEIAIDKLCLFPNILAFNDMHTHSEVLAKFDEAILQCN